jgi:micrococcal nuclease
MSRRPLLLLLILALFAPLLPDHVATAQEPEWELPADAVRAELVDVVDGDTFDVDLLDGSRRSEERVRLIGIDTPETSYAFGNEPECYGPEAARRTESLLVAADEIWLSEDVDPEDRYGRLLRYVWYVSPVDGEVHFLNRELVAEGYALAKTYRPNTEYQRELEDAQEVAIREGRGLWLACDASVSMDPTLEADGRPDEESIDRTRTPVSEDEEAACSLFNTYDEAQDFLAEFPEVADLIDPDADGRACEGYFGR